MAENLNPNHNHTSHSASPRRSRAKKKADPFDRIPQLSPSPAPKAVKDEDKHEEDKTSESMFQTIIMGPLIFTSFVVSLFLVDRRDRAWRVRQHPLSASFWTRINPVNWLDPEPYQDPNDTTWKKDEGSGDATNPIMDGPIHSAGQKGWFRRKKHRKMAKYEFEDAFAIRESVAAWLVGAGVLVVGGSAYVVKGWVGW